MKVVVTVSYQIDFPTTTLAYYSDAVIGAPTTLDAVRLALREDFDHEDPSVFQELCTDGWLLSVEPA